MAEVARQGQDRRLTASQLNQFPHYLVAKESTVPRSLLLVPIFVGMMAGLTRASAPPTPKGDGPLHEAELVFPLHPKHNHAPGIVECPNGDLLVSWYRGSGERSADDVAVYGARKKARANQWGDAFLLADTPAFPDCNTTLFIDGKGRLWLFWPVILANSWESCLTCYRVSSDYQGDGAPKWEWQGIIPLRPKDFEEVMVREFAVWQKQVAGLTTPRVTEDMVKQKASVEAAHAGYRGCQVGRVGARDEHRVAGLCADHGERGLVGRWAGFEPVGHACVAKTG